MEQPIRLERFGSGFGRRALEVQKCLITAFFKGTFQWRNSKTAGLYNSRCGLGLLSEIQNSLFVTAISVSAVHVVIEAFLLRLEKGMSTQLLDAQIVRAVLGTET